MEEINITKTRADFSTDSEWWTYKITHPEQFPELNYDNNENEEDEKKEKPYPLIIVQCLKCGYIIDENEAEPKPDEEIPYKDRIKCPKCKNKAKFKAIKDKEEKEKILKAAKEKAEKEKREKLRFIKLTLKKLQEDLEKLREELEEDLNSGKITPERYAALMINITFNMYKYYRHDDRMEMFFSEFREYAYGVSENVLKKHYEEQELDEKLNEILVEYEQVKEFDMIYLKQALISAKNAEIVAETSDIEINKYDIQSDINRLEYQIEQQQKYNEDVKELLEKDKERKNDIDELKFFKDLKRVNGI